MGGIFRCPVCGHEYDQARGDPSQGIGPETPFRDLPPGWRCPVCTAEKSAFVEV